MVVVDGDGDGDGGGGCCCDCGRQVRRAGKERLAGRAGKEGLAGRAGLLATCRIVKLGKNMLCSSFFFSFLWPRGGVLHGDGRWVDERDLCGRNDDCARHAYISRKLIGRNKGVTTRQFSFIFRRFIPLSYVSWHVQLRAPLLAPPHSSQSALTKPRNPAEARTAMRFSISAVQCNSPTRRISAIIITCLYTVKYHPKLTALARHFRAAKTIQQKNKTILFTQISSHFSPKVRKGVRLTPPPHML